MSSLKQDIRSFLACLEPKYVLGLSKIVFVGPRRLATFRLPGGPVRSPGRVFVTQYRDIFIEERYRFDCARPDPTILDLGANYGYSCMYFKHLFPRSRIVAFEADPAIYRTLAGNLARCGHSEIELHNVAAWTSTGTIPFVPDGLGGGAVGCHARRCAEPCDVPTLDLRDWLTDRRYDLIKMDIEGAENEVLPHCIDQIAACPRLIMEYHSEVGKRQHLRDLLALLEARGFRIHIDAVFAHNGLSPGPPHGQFDNQLLVYARKEHEATA